MKQFIIISSLFALASAANAQNRNAFKQMDSILGVTVTRAATQQGTSFTVSVAANATIVRSGKSHKLEAIDGFWLLSNKGDLGAVQVALNNYDNHSNNSGGSSAYGSKPNSRTASALASRPRSRSRQSAIPPPSTILDSRSRLRACPPTFTAATTRAPFPSPLPLPSSALAWWPFESAALRSLPDSRGFPVQERSGKKGRSFSFCSKPPAELAINFLMPL